ncbi:MAG: T9SS type A sorting domain-containing protein [Bacteroidetes bacterium]|nr:T9SS type A sorting domain-containing protein [Bacteroidota bacterium]
MKNLLLTTILVTLLLPLFCQQTVYWRDQASNGNWANTIESNINNWWRQGDGWDVRRPDLASGQWSPDGTKSYNIIIFSNAHELTTTVNGNIGGTKYYVHRLELRNSSNRTFNNSDNGYLSMGGGSSNAKIEAISGEGTGSYTFNVPITYEKVTELNPVGGDLIFNSLITNNSYNTLVYGNSTQSLTIAGGLSGTGGLLVKNITTVIISTDADYSGATIVEAGTLELRGSISSSNVTVHNGATLRINGSNISVASLTIETGGSVVIEPGKSLTVSGTLTNNAFSSDLVIKSNASGTGSLIHSTSGVSATVERYFPQTSQAWHFLSAPVGGSISSSAFVPGTSDDFYAWHEPSPGTWVNYKNTTVSPTFPDVNGSNFVAGQGYLVAYTGSGPTKNFSGTLNQGNVSIQLKNSSGSKSWTYESGWNLLGNPYPSGIDWNSVDRSLFDDNYAYAYNPNKSGGEGYETINGGSSGAYIAPHQGFFVKAKTTSNNQNFTFTNSIRVHGGTYFKSSQNVDKISIRLAAYDYFDETEIRLLEGSQLERDRQDALKLFSFNNQVPQLYSFSSDSVMLAVNSIPEFYNDLEIPLGFKAPVSGVMTLSLQDTQGKFNNYSWRLIDKLTNVVWNLSQQPYIFTTSQGSDNERFALKLGIVGINENPEDATKLQAAMHNGQLWVNNPSANSLLRIHDLSGRLLQQMRLTEAGLQQLNTHLKAGAYILHLQGSNQTLSAKVINR